MPGRNRDEAWRAFLTPLERAVGTVDLTARLKGRHVSDDVSVVTSGIPGLHLARPGCPETNLFLAMTLRCIPDDAEKGPFRMTTMKYDFELSEAGSVVFGWHWHPESKRSNVKWPHLHLPAGSVHKSKHVPTGRVALEDVLLFAILDMSVQPAHGEAIPILNDVAERHKKHRSWA